jgi:hypothetical protein
MNKRRGRRRRARPRHVQELAAGPPVELNPAERARVTEFRRMLSALGPADLEAAGMG